jgi:aspartate/methionine/tyrosine aminotransferase
LNIVTRYIQDSTADNFKSVSTLLDRNRDYAREELNGDKLTFVESMIETSVAWFEINDPELTADELHEHLLKYNVYVLSGKYFYWNNTEKGQRFIRLALARDSDILFRSVNAIKEALNDLN